MLSDDGWKQIISDTYCTVLYVPYLSVLTPETADGTDDARGNTAESNYGKRKTRNWN